MSGFYLMHRGWMDDPIFDNFEKKFTDRLAWIWLIEQACYEPHSVRVGYDMVTVNRGQVPTSYRKLREAWGWGNNKIIKTLQLWEKYGKIEIKTERGLTLINICNYDKFQSPSKSSGTKTERKRNENGTEVETNIKKGKEIKEGKRKNNPLPPLVIPDSIPKSDWEDFCKHRGSGFTRRAKELILADLEALRQSGNDPGEVLRQSIKRGWSGVFEIKEKNYGAKFNNNKSQHDKLGGVWAEIVRERSGG